MERYENEPFAIVGVNCRDTEEEYREGVREYGVTWTNAFDGMEMEIADLWGVRSFPTMHVIDAEGRIHAMNVRGEDRIARIVDDLLEEMREEEEPGEGAPR